MQDGSAGTITISHDYRRGLEKLVAAIMQDEPDPGPDLEEALERSHMSHARWQACLEQMEACRYLTRRQLGLLRDGTEGWEALDPGSPEQTIAGGLRVFLRHLACLVEGDHTLASLAAEVHAIIYGPEAVDADVTWRDYQQVLTGRDGQPSVWQLREAADLIRQGYGREPGRRLGGDGRTVQDIVGIGEKPVKALQAFLGIGDWRRESRLRAGRLAIANGWSADELADNYNAEIGGMDHMSTRNAREYIARAREAEEAVA